MTGFGSQSITVSQTMTQKVDPEQLKQAMRAWVTGVAIVTGHHNGQIHGLTANSFNAIALTPPTILVALQNHSHTKKIVQDGGVFAVSILESTQISIAKRFAGQIDGDKPRFEGIDTFTMITGAPLISNARAFLDCKVVKFFDVGNTTVFLGEVLEAKADGDNREPLLYLNRKWRKLANDE